MKRALIVVLAVVLGSCSLSLAQQGSSPATKEDVAELFRVLQPEKQMTAVMQAVAQQLPTMIEGSLGNEKNSMTPEQRELFTKFLQETSTRAFNTLPMKEMFEAMYPAYERHFTHDDIQQLTAFYSSPTGQKYLNEAPAIAAESMQDLMPIIQRWQTELQAQVKHDAEEYVRKMRAPEKTIRN